MNRLYSYWSLFHTFVVLKIQQLCLVLFHLDPFWVVHFLLYCPTSVHLFSCIYCELINIDKFPFIFLQQNLDASHLKNEMFSIEHIFVSSLSRFLKTIFNSYIKSLRILDELKFSSGIISLVFFLIIATVIISHSWLLTASLT